MKEYHLFMTLKVHNTHSFYSFILSQTVMLLFYFIINNRQLKSLTTTTIPYSSLPNTCLSLFEFRSMYPVWKSFLEGTMQVAQSRINICENYKNFKIGRAHV